MALNNKTNNPNLVTVGRPKAGGAVFYAPVGTALPETAKAALGSEFKCLGCITEDGITVTPSAETDEIKDWEGTTVAITESGYSEEYKFSLMEYANEEVHKFIYGEDSVTGSLTSSLKVLHKMINGNEYVLIIDSLLKGGKINRLIVPRAKISEVGDITRKRDEAVVFEVTAKGLAHNLKTGETVTSLEYMD